LAKTRVVEIEAKYFTSQISSWIFSYLSLSILRLHSGFENEELRACEEELNRGRKAPMLQYFRHPHCWPPVVLQIVRKPSLVPHYALAQESKVYSKIQSVNPPFCFNWSARLNAPSQKCQGSAVVVLSKQFIVYVMCDEKKKRCVYRKLDHTPCFAFIFSSSNFV
jgi:hypothetical protein